jgi:hypothetical protein
MNASLFLFGLMLLVFHRRMGDYASRQWDEAFPRRPISRHVDRVVFLLVGLVFATIGVMSMFGVIAFR